jgi:hypothetical protein
VSHVPWWRRALQYEFRFSVGFLLAVVLIVIIINLAWSHVPTWVFFPVGAAIGAVESSWRRHKKETTP